MVFVKMIDLPVTVKAFVHRNDDDSYTIILNSRLCREQNVRSYLHELQHIDNADLGSFETADSLEYKRHEGRAV